jgi:undecaprenyl-diphosphatase
MSALQACVLGMVQGLGEFLPISSSAHLILVPWLLGWPEHSLSFDVALHVGTLVAVVTAFAGDWWRMLSAALRGLIAGEPWREADARLLWLIALASVPGAIAGLLLDKWAETTLRSPLVVATALATLGLVLALADRRAGTGAGTAPPISLRDALLIGLAQALAVIPGVSRSGATISMALFLGHRRESAARFSFLLATPITLGAALVKARHLIGGGDTALLLGMATAALFGLASIQLLLRYVRTRNYTPFVVYRIAMACLVFGVALVGLRRLG